MFHHEFWPAPIFYAPIFLFYLGQAIKFKSLNYFSWVNPCMANGGLIGYSKYDVLKKLPKEYVPQTLLISKEQGFSFIEATLIQSNFQYPLIAKPDQGARGFGVAFIENTKQLRDYHAKAKMDYLVQAYLDAPQEFGVFVVRTNKDFFVTSIIQKDFLTLYGDGRSSLKELFYKHPRASRYFTEKNLPMYSERVLQVGETVLLEPIGNHCRGTKFVNANSIIDDKLAKTFKDLSEQVPGFYYGRFDVKATSIENLKSGDFKVMELNGASAEPGHIYDSTYPVKAAYRDLFWHWKKISEIVEHNSKVYPKESFWQTLMTVKNYYRLR